MSKTILILTATIAGAVLSASLLWAKPKQPTDQDICSGRQTAVYGNCLNNGGTEDQCWKASLRRYNQCMQDKGHAPGTYAPIQASPTPTPKVGASIHPINGGATTIKSNQATPTPNPNTSPKKSQGDHHHHG